ncbi:MAG: hypothetical protein GY853_10960 [PVC group bacterium]|nr:hypothetical protein [PVC group bacterium]
MELLVATVLSAQCTDKRGNIITRGLFEKYKTVNDYAQAEKDWGALNYLLIEHGRNVCIARNPQCGRCFLSEYCAYFSINKQG